MGDSIDINLYKSLCDADDRNTELKKYDDLKLLYQFSAARRNLLDWYEFDPGAELLEIGSECGALTELFSQRVKRVVSIEKSQDMAEINKYRNRTAENVEIICTDLESFETEQSFKYIVLAGVIEKASDYMKTEKPAADLLKKVSSLLAEDGEIIFAASNMMGLQYLAGLADERTGIAFEGISKDSGLYTRSMLQKIFDEAGLKVTETYYPIPDYRMPEFIYSDEYQPLPGDYSLSPFSYSENSYKMFDETKAADVLLENGEWDNYANSYLFILK